MTEREICNLPQSVALWLRVMFGTVIEPVADVQREAVPKPAVGIRLPVSDDASTVQALREMIARSGLTQAQLAERAGMGVENLRKYLIHTRCNQFKPLSVRMLARLATICGARVVLEEIV